MASPHTINRRLAESDHVTLADPGNGKTLVVPGMFNYVNLSKATAAGAAETRILAAPSRHGQRIQISFGAQSAAALTLTISGSTGILMGNNTNANVQGLVYASMANATDSTERFALMEAVMYGGVLRWCITQATLLTIS